MKNFKELQNLLSSFALILVLFSCSQVKNNKDSAKVDTTKVAEANTRAIDSVNETKPAEQVGFDQIPLVQEFQPGIKAANDKRKADMFKQIKFRGKGSEERQKGVEMASEGNMKGAIEQFTKSIEIFSKNPDAYFYRGKAKWELKDYKGSEEDFAQAIAIRPLQAPYYYYRGQMFLDQQKYKEALADFNETIKLAPNYIDAMNYKGVVLAKTGRHEDAIAIYNEAIAKDPAQFLTYYNKGTSLAALKKFNDADDMFTRALNLNPDYAQAYVNRGNCRFMLERFNDAADDYTQAISRKTNNAEAYYNRAFAFQRSGKPTEACTDWRKASELGHKDADNMLSKYCK